MNENIVSRLKKALRRDGLSRTVKKVIVAPGKLISGKIQSSRHARRLRAFASLEDAFTWIHNSNHWGNGESVSGDGSTIKYTENLRKQLPSLFSDFAIGEVFDAPCGDFNWMRLLLNTVEVNYTGGDIVRSLIDNLNLRHASETVSFVHFDLTTQLPPKVDLVICRDCLFHFSYKDTLSVLERFLESGSKYFLTTTHRNGNPSFVNADIISGDFRRIDLFAFPYQFASEPLRRIEDWVSPHAEREMCLWSRDQIEVTLLRFKYAVSPARLD